MKTSMFIGLMLLFSALAVPPCAHAAFAQFDVKNLDFTYQQGQGELSFDLLSLASPENDTQIREQLFEFNFGENFDQVKINNDFMTTQFPISVKKLASSVAHLNVQDLNLSLGRQTTLHIEVGQLHTHIGNGIQEISGIQLHCPQSNADMDLKTLQACAGGMSLRVQKLSLAAASSETYYSLFPNSISGKKDFNSAKVIKEIDFNVKNHEFALHFATKLLFTFHVNITGRWQVLLEDTSNPQVNITINTAKVSIFNIKRLLLFAISHAKLSNITIENDTVVISF